MAITADAGPQINYGITVSSSGTTGEYNEHRAPSLNDMGAGILDPRSQYNYGYNPGQGVSAGGTSTSGPYTFGFWNNAAIVDFIPGTISTNVITTNSTVTASVALNLSASGINASKITIIAPETQTSTTVICIDAPCGGSSNAGVQFGSAGTINVWNPASVCGRGISINLSSNLDTGTWSIAGRDVYGFKVTETIAASSHMLSLKTYKYISQIVASSGATSTGAIVGTTDTYGFPFYVNHPSYVQIWVGASSVASLITVNAGNHVFGSSLAVATSTNGDVRGTYASSVASSTANATRIVMVVTPQVANSAGAGSSLSGLNNMTATSYAAYFGATQFSSV